MVAIGFVEIPATDLARAMAFYRGVFGVEFEVAVIDGNEMAFFPVAAGDGASAALAAGDSYAPSLDGVRAYVAVAAIDDVLGRAVDHGGEVLYPKTSIGELGFVAEFRDSEGNRIALMARS